MNFHLDNNLNIFDELLKKRLEISKQSLKIELQKYYLPFIEKLINLSKNKNSDEGIIVGVSAIQGAGKTTQGEILETLLDHFGLESFHLSIDNHYLTHEQLNKLRESDPRYIRRGVTHDIPLAIQNLRDLKTLVDGTEVKIPIYDKGAFNGDGDRTGWDTITKKPQFIFYDGWMLGARSIEDESVFDSGLPALQKPEDIAFAKMINQKLKNYEPLWDLIDFMNVLYVPNYQNSLNWRDQAEEALRAKGEGMSHDQIIKFVHYFWRSVHPAIHIKNLAQNHADQVVIINDDHSIKEVLTPQEVKQKYP